MLGGRSLSRSLLLKLLLLALMAAGVLVFASAALAQPSSDNGFATLTKTASPNPVTVGQQLTFTLTETADPAKSDVGFSVIDTLPAGVRFVSATSSQGTCAFDPVANTVTCGPFYVANPTSPPLYPTTTFTASIVVVPTTPGTITNTAHDNWNFFLISNNVVSVDVTVLPLPQQEKQHAPSPPAVAPEVTQAPSQTYVSGANTNNAGSVQTGGP